MTMLTWIINRHPGCVLAALMAVVPFSFGLWIGTELYVDRLAIHPYWLFAFWALVFIFFAIVKKHVAKPAVARLAAELCEAGSWKASGSGFSGRIGAYTIVDVWAREGGRPFNSLMLEGPHRIGFLLERTSKGGVVELAGGRTLFGVGQFGLFPKCPYPFDHGDRLALQTDDIGAFTRLTEKARFVGALAALDKIQALRCLISL